MQSVVDASVRKLRRLAWPLFALCLWCSGLYSGSKWKDQVHPQISDNSLILERTSSVCPKSIVVPWDLGRFGNKFFEYMAARLMAEVLGSEIYIAKGFGEVYDKYFTGRKTGIIDWSYMQYKCGIVKSNCSSLPINYLPELKPISNETAKCIYFIGYSKNITARQFEGIYSRRDELIQEFQWKPELRNYADKKLKEIRTKRNTTTVVAVHARRTDYFIYLVTNYGEFRPANASYYNKAMDYFRGKYSNPAFLVFGDDMKWCRENFNSSDIFFTDDHNDPGKDLVLMSSCNHLILSYGTYGLAAAWFNNHGEVISADKFTEKPELMVEELKRVPSLKWMWMPV